MAQSEASQRDSREYKEEEFKEDKINAIENRLAQSERVRPKAKSTICYNYLQNRMSVRINYGGNDKSLAGRLLSAYNQKQIR